MKCHIVCGGSRNMNLNMTFCSSMDYKQQHSSWLKWATNTNTALCRIMNYRHQQQESKHQHEPQQQHGPLLLRARVIVHWAVLGGRDCTSSKLLNTTQQQCAAILPHPLPPSHRSSFRCYIPPYPPYPLHFNLSKWHCKLLCVTQYIFFCPNNFTCKYYWSGSKFLVSEALLLDILMLPRVRAGHPVARQGVWGQDRQSFQISWHNSLCL